VCAAFLPLLSPQCSELHVSLSLSPAMSRDGVFNPFPLNAPTSFAVIDDVLTLSSIVQLWRASNAAALYESTLPQQDAHGNDVEGEDDGAVVLSFTEVLAVLQIIAQGKPQDTHKRTHKRRVSSNTNTPTPPHTHR
jgi:hypothetical protein